MFIDIQMALSPVSGDAVFMSEEREANVCGQGSGYLRFVSSDKKETMSYTGWPWPGDLLEITKL